MKRAIYLLMAVLMITQCADQVDNITDDLLQIEGSHLSIDEIKEYLPSEYFSGYKVIYKNENNGQKVLQTKSIESFDERSLDGMKYISDKFEITLFEERNLSFEIIVDGASNYSNDGKSINKGLGAWLMPFNESGTTWARLRFKDGKPDITWADDFRDQIQLNSTIFNDVLVTIGKNNLQVQYEKYSELILNSEVGIVAFRDDNNELWVFDKFEK